MKILKFVFVFFLIGELIIWARGSQSFYLWDTLPFMDHSLPPIYILGAIVMLVLLFRGLGKLNKTGGNKP